MADAHRLLELVTSSWIAQATHVAAALGLADLLRDGPRTSQDLAAATTTDPPSLHRLLRALTTLDLCRERDDGRFEITPLGSLLGTNVPGSLRAWTIWWGQYLWPVWGELLYSVRTGQSARARLMGMAGFGHLTRDPEVARVFNQAMVELTRLAAERILRHYDFSPLARIADVGGGYGELLACILHAYPDASGILFDMEHAVREARRRFEEAGLAVRCDFQAGDFFQTVPEGADAYLLKSVLHDWDDANCVRILQSCHRAMVRKARLLVIERMVPQRLEVSPEHQAFARTDLNMLIAHGAQERTEAAFRALLESAGFRVARVLPVGATFCVLEAFPLAQTTAS